MQNPFRYFNSSPEVIRLTVMMYIRYTEPLLVRSGALADHIEEVLTYKG
jgi:hypothetical protein